LKKKKSLIKIAVREPGEYCKESGRNCEAERNKAARERGKEGRDQLTVRGRKKANKDMKIY
jgi:hypothetical protein